MKGEVYRATITITVMGFAESDAAFRHQIEGMDLGDIMEESDTGSFVAGTKTVESIECIQRDALPQELEAVGSDISFFESELED